MTEELQNPWANEPRPKPSGATSNETPNPWAIDDAFLEQEVPNQAISPFWEDAEDWNTCNLGGFKLPGLVDVTCTLGRKLDIKSPPGSDGGTITDKGYELAKIKIKCTMWLQEHKQELRFILKALHPRASTLKKAFGISYPSTELLGIRSVYIQTITGPNIGKIPGTKEIEFTCVEWAKPTKVNKTATVPSAQTLLAKDQAYNELITGQRGFTPNANYNQAQQDRQRWSEMLGSPAESGTPVQVGP
jgi:hypothetical protein